MKNDAYDNRMGLSDHRGGIPPSKLLSGSITNKYPVILDDGKTIIFIADKNREAEIRLRYKSRGH
ncbi:MAG: hypothetical protein M0Q38_02800 [Bacteroidales bacterium]|nr:hypothetical protein [Bacteroidales bacterium]